MFDAETLKFVFVNRGARNNIGYTMEELEEMTPMQITPEYDERSFRRHVEQLVSGKSEKTVFETCHRRADGSRYDVEVHLQRVEGIENMLLVAVVLDITERKEAEHKLKQSEKKYRLLFRNNPEPMWIFNVNTLEFVEVNRAAVEHYGYSEEEFLSMTIADIRPDEDVEKLVQAIENNKNEAIYGEEWRHVTSQGNRIAVRISATDIVYEGKPGYRLVLANDITELKQAKKKIINSFIEGEERERARIARELHDGIGQYLSAAQMNLEAVKDHLQQLPEKRGKQYTRGVNWVKEAISEIRTISHNLMPRAITDQGFAAALESLVESYSNNDIQFTLKYDYDPQNSPLTKQQLLNLYRVVQEAINNAVKHSGCSRIRIHLSQTDRKLVVHIQDNGRGYYHTSSTKFGIQSMKTRLEALGGTITFDSEAGEGTTIRISIPFAHYFKTTNYSNCRRSRNHSRWHYRTA